MDKEPETPEEHEALVILTRLAEHLRQQYLPFPVNGRKVIPEWMAKAADSIELYLNNLNVKSLDAAFGLEQKQGRPSNDARREYIGRTAIAMKRENMPWKEIARKLESENIYIVERCIRDYAKEFALRVMIEEAAESIFQDPVNGDK